MKEKNMKRKECNQIYVSLMRFHFSPKSSKQFLYCEFFPESILWGEIGHSERMW